MKRGEGGEKRGREREGREEIGGGEREGGRNKNRKRDGGKEREQNTGREERKAEKEEGVRKWREGGGDR